MKERFLFVYIDSIAAATLCFWALSPAPARFPFGFACWIGTMLSLSVYLLLCYMKAPRPARLLPLIIAAVISIAYSPESALPLLAVLLVTGYAEIFPHKLSRSGVTALAFAAICALYAWFVKINPSAPEGSAAVLLSIVFIAFTAYCLHMLSRREADAEERENKSSELERYREVIQNRQRVEKTAEQVSRLTERNRLASRIHDEIGHGMSGSILMLEGAAMVMDGDPEKAKQTVLIVAENMRISVDEIRRVLREERSETTDISLAQIENELNIFEVSHPGIKTEFITKGDLSRVRQTIWRCIYENLREALTNTLKHAHATAFRVEIEHSNLLLRVEFADRVSGEHIGTTGREVREGIGLQTIEERCALCYGRSFVEATPTGFRILMTFPQSAIT
jgi:signal transduction histidine kinase